MVNETPRWLKYTITGLVCAAGGLIGGLELGKWAHSPRSAYNTKLDNDERDDLVVVTGNGSRRSFLASESGENYVILDDLLDNKQSEYRETVKANLERSKN